MLNPVGPEQVEAAFHEALGRLGLQPSLWQRDVKLPVVLTVDALVGLAYGREQPLPRLWANHIEFTEQDDLLRFTRHVKLESMLDVAVYRGESDPYAPLATAESEAHSEHSIEENSGSETSDYLWDLYKLLQVPSPLRLFIARIGPGAVPDT